MKFRYWTDPLFLFCLAGYCLNRWCLKALFDGGFLHEYFNDLICIPFWVPIMLYVMRLMRVRQHDQPPQSCEILVPLVLWSAWFEVILPYTSSFRNISYGDHLDVLCYTLGAAVAALFWGRYYLVSRIHVHTKPVSP